MRKFSVLTAMLGILFLSLSACSSDDEREYNDSTSNADGLIPVRINIGGIESNPAPASRVAAKDGEATLIPISKAQTRTAMATDVKYRVFVFNSDDECVAYKEIKAGSESDTSNQLELESGTYSFLAYSYNSTADMPTYSDPTGKSITDNAFKLTVSPLVDKDGGDLLYAKNIGVDISSASATVTLSFYHKFTLIEPVGTAKIVAATNSVFYMDGAVTPFYVNGGTDTNITELTATVSSYETATLTFDTSSLTTAATTALTSPTNLTTAPVTVTSTNTTSVAYLPSRNQNINLIISAAKYNNAGATTEATGLPKTYTYSGATVSLGIAYQLNYSFAEGGGTIKTLYWATGNLRYTDYNQGAGTADGTYSFFRTQDGFDGSPTDNTDAKNFSYFEWNALYPIGSQIPGYTNNTTTAYDEDLDPCRRYVDPVNPNRVWRTPKGGTVTDPNNEFAPLKTVWDKRTNAQKNRFDTFNGHNGFWFGVIGTPSDTESQSQYLFLPAAGNSSGLVGRNGNYWSATPSSTSTARLFGFNDGILGAGSNSSNSNLGRSVRCVSDYPQ
jgi:hypothetical protein